MIEKPYFELDRRAQLRSWVAGHMLQGAGWAALVVTGGVLAILIIHWVGLLLPPESKQAPSPYGAIESVQTTFVG